MRSSSSLIRHHSSDRPVGTREWLVATSGGLTLAFTAWGLGGIPAWSLHILLVGGLTTLALALCPWPKRWRMENDGWRRAEGQGQKSKISRALRSCKRSTGSRRPEEANVVSSLATALSETSNDSSLSAIRHSPLHAKGVPPLHAKRDHSSFIIHHSSSATAASRLLRWPPFWFTFLFLLYLLIGALNPAAEIVRDERGWWVEAIQPTLATWLPTSVRADYQPMNAWRVLVSFTASFTLIWGLWAGLTRRKPVLLVLWCLLLSGASMGLVAILQHLTDAKAVLWTFPSSNENFWGSFFYRNQSAAFLNLVLVAAGVLFFYHAKKTQELGRSGGPHFLCFLLFAAVATSIGLALSRGGILFASILSIVFLVFVTIYALRSLAHLSSLWAGMMPLALLVVGAVTLVRYVDLDAIDERFGDLSETIETADQDARALSSRATWDMAQDRLGLGWGAGSFRYIFPMYQQNYPELFYSRYHPRKEQWIGRRMYRYAHNDLLQFAAEYGLIGIGLLVLTFSSILLPLFSCLRHLPFAIIYLATGIICACLHAAVDFIFNSPAYWLAFVGLIASVTKLLRLEAGRSSFSR